LVATVVATPTAEAGNCTGSLCGGALNRSGRIMGIARLGEGKESCPVWNRHDVPVESVTTFTCKQEPLPAGYRKGGNGTGDDVDAFSFNFEDYWVRFTTVGGWIERKKGIWTKIVDGLAAVCGRGAQGRIECTVRPFHSQDMSFPLSPPPSLVTPGAPTSSGRH
jgi:hypothetical protein